MRLFGKMKSNSRLALKHNRKNAVLILCLSISIVVFITLLMAVATYFIQGGFPPSNPTMEEAGAFNAMLPYIIIIQAVVLVFFVFLINHISLGKTAWYVSLIKNEAKPFSEIFAFFDTIKRYFRAAFYSLNMLVRTLLWAILFFILPCAILLASAASNKQYLLTANRQFAVISAIGLLFGILVTVLALFLYLAYMNKYFLVQYLMCGDKNIKLTQAFKNSAELTKGYRFSILWYSLSFTGWFLLTVICFPVMFYTVPYIKASISTLACYLIERKDIKEAIHAEPQPDNETREFLSYQAEAYASGASLHYVEEPTLQMSAADMNTLSGKDMPLNTSEEDDEAAPDNSPQIPQNYENHPDENDDDQDGDEGNEEPPAHDSNGKWPYV